MEWQENLDDTKAKLDSVSPSFCLAKWLQVTLHLQNGFNHSCHHPRLHKIPLDELAANPAALHNTLYKKKLREMMLKGLRPTECTYCWKVEDVPGSHFSDRIIKSADSWAKPKLESIAASSPLADINPTYLEVSFGNECNFRCAYCLPHISSSIWAEYEKYGEYINNPSLKELTSQGLRPYSSGEVNPYVDAFWKWFPQAVGDLRVFRITGGEPLVNSNTMRVLEYLEQNPQPHLEFCVNSNLGVPAKIFDRFLEKINSLTEGGKIKNFTLFTSIDTHGKQAEYIRHGLNYERWLENVRTYLTKTSWPITHMITFNALSVVGFIPLLKDMLALNEEFLGTYGDGVKYKRTMLDISYLTNPQYLSALILPASWQSEMRKNIEFMESNSKERVGARGFLEYEIHKLQRIGNWIQSSDPQSPESQHNRGAFYIFSQQYQERKGLDFLRYFPEMEEFYSVCKSDSKEISNSKSAKIK